MSRAVAIIRSTRHLLSTVVGAALLLVLHAGLAPAVQAQSAEGLERMQAWSNALGVTCDHCHIEGEWTLTALPAFDIAYRMSRMVDAVNSGVLKGTTGVTCNTCHRGTLAPQGLSTDAWQAVATTHEADFNGDGNLRIGMSVYAASLGVACTHCHVAGNFGSDDHVGKQAARRMRGMMGGMSRHFAGARKSPLMQCYFCHQGKAKPEP